MKFKSLVALSWILALFLFAWPNYSHFTRQVKLAEPTTLLPQIMLKQATYFLEMRELPNLPKSPSSSAWGKLCKGQRVAWKPKQNNWLKVSFQPPGPVGFQYWAVAGQGKTTKTFCGGLINLKPYKIKPKERWTVFCARGDLQGTSCQNPDKAPLWFGMVRFFPRRNESPKIFSREPPTHMLAIVGFYIGGIFLLLAPFLLAKLRGKEKTRSQEATS